MLIFRFLDFEVPDHMSEYCHKAQLLNKVPPTSGIFKCKPTNYFKMMVSNWILQHDCGLI